MGDNKKAEEIQEKIDKTSKEFEFSLVDSKESLFIASFILLTELLLNNEDAISTVFLTTFSTALFAAEVPSLRRWENLAGISTGSIAALAGFNLPAAIGAGFTAAIAARTKAGRGLAALPFKVAYYGTKKTASLAGKGVVLLKDGASGIGNGVYQFSKGCINSVRNVIEALDNGCDFIANKINRY